MGYTRSLFLWVTGLSAVWAQAPTAPVISPRGVINAFTQQPAPSNVGRGGILQISGLNLGPPQGATAAGPPLPTQLADVQVLLKGNPIPLFSVNPSTIMAQVPVDADVGLAEIVVQRDSGTSRPARFFITAIQPSVRSQDGSGYGQVWGTNSGQSLSISATGWTDTPPLTAFIGGIRTNVTATPSATRAGEFDVQMDIPAAARAGDLVSLSVGGRPADRTVLRPLKTPDVQFLPLPDGTPELRDLEDTGVNGNYVIATGARAESGCYPAVILDFVRKTTTSIGDCLTTGNANALTPLVAPNEGDVIGALIGPPQGAPPDGVSSQVEIFGPGKDTPLAVTLPSAASTLAAAGEDFAAVLPGTPPQFVTIDGQTGEVRSGLGGGGGAGAGGLLAMPSLNVDGLTHALSQPVPVGQGRAALIVADDPDKPTRAKFAIVNFSGDTMLSKDFPSGWMPLLGPPRPAGPGGGGGGGVRFAPPREAVQLDASTRMFYALARAADASKDAFIAFPLDRSDPNVLAFPDGWFAASCTPNIGIFSLDLSRAAAVIGSQVAEMDIKNPCTGAGFIELDLISKTLTAVPLQSQAQINAGAGGSADVNDYVYGIGSDGSQSGLSDSVYVLDGVSGSTFSLTMPTGIRGFTGLAPIREISSLIAAATNNPRRRGDAGMVIFDLYNETVQVVPVPDGFDTLTDVGVFLATRKVAVLAVNADTAASQLFLYDLNTGDLVPAPNPDGVAAVGARPPAPGGGPGGPGGPGQGAGRMLMLSSNARANTVAAIALDANGKQVGVVVVRVP